jgi:hypothetical protein
MGLNAQTSVPTFTANQILTAEQQNGINNGIPVFATTVTRDAAFGGTGEKTLAQGQYAYIEATSTLQVYTGSAWLAVGGGLTLVKAQTIGSGVSAVTVTDAFSATYDNYLMTVSGGVASADTSLVLTLGSTTTGYYWLGSSQQYGSSTLTSTFVNNGASFQSVVYGSTNALSGQCVIDNPFATKRTMVRYEATGSSTTYFRNQAQGFLDNATSYTAFTLTTSAGTVTGGTIRVYGYQNS